MRVAIAGYGMEGEASYRYYEQLGEEVTILDEREHLDREIAAHARVVLGGDAFANLEQYDIIVRTPALSPRKLVGAKKIWSATNEFFAKCPALIIAVTGTKGKGTTSSLISHILQTAGYRVHLLGNIGTPALEVLPNIAADDIVVFEISSFQLWDLERSPHIAVVLMIEPDHLDVHENFDDYINAKANIRRHQTLEDICIYHPTNQFSSQIAHISEIGTMIRYRSHDAGSVFVENGQFMIDGHVICSTDALQLVGEHNIENACAAITAARAYTQDDDAIAEGLRGFTGLPHRLQLVRECNDVAYYNDSYSSAPGATIAALRSFTQPIVLIAGGYDKHTEYDELARVIASIPNIKHVCLMGQTRQKIASALDVVGFDAYELHDDQALAPIFGHAVSIAESGDVVLLSPGCASFDMFTNFTDRGQQFCKLVEAL
ncbi:MAG: UDP-N-acetylmuramoyl-L-alanine--D-glutamate ligase [Candidatus Saccharimonas sp.]